jgi:hypothetical protein
MYFKGEKKTFNIDDAIGVTRYGHAYAAKKSKDGAAWWMPILEKGYAKFNVNYISLAGG